MRPGTSPIGIKFGTDGWRGVTARDFTFGNVRRVAQAISDFLKGQTGKAKIKPLVVIGYDQRFQADAFAEEIARVAIRRKARVVGLSIVYPADDPDLPAELLRLGRFLPDDVELLIGGRAAAAYQEAIDEIGARVVSDLAGAGRALDQLRVGSGK